MGMRSTVDNLISKILLNRNRMGKILKDIAKQDTIGEHAKTYKAMLGFYPSFQCPESKKQKNSKFCNWKEGI
jgi:hypothetical protein